MATITPRFQNQIRKPVLVLTPPLNDQSAKLRNKDLEKDLIFDAGSHTGQDTAFYLKKGFRVVAIEADPSLCEHLEQRFRRAIHNHRLTIVNKAIASEQGLVSFYRNLDESVWGTIDSEWVERNDRLGTKSEAITIEATTMPDLLRQFGVPYFLKIDIEGLDIVALGGLATASSRPKYVSIESDKDSFKTLRREIRKFVELGYDRFKAVNQMQVPKQSPPNPPLEGKLVDHTFEDGASGLFGEEAPGEWLSAEQIIEAYKPICLRDALTGNDRLISSRIIRQSLRCLGLGAAWYDTHAKLCDNYCL
jgi:FkbM family methyltransferase